MTLLKDIPKKILKGDFSSLFALSRTRGYIHPAEVAQLISVLPFENCYRTFNSLPDKNQIRVFAYLDIQLQRKIVLALPKHRAALILNLSTDDRVTFYASLKGRDIPSFLNYLDEKSKDATHGLLDFPEDSVARLLNTDFATVTRNMTIGEAGEHLRKNHKDSEAANVIYVVDDEGRLIDDVPVRRFILSDPDKHIEDILDGFCVTLNMNDTKEYAVEKFKEYDRVVLPVVNDDNKLMGVVTVDDMLDVAEKKDTEEMLRFGGVETLDYPYVKTPFFSLIRKRAGWLIILFVGEMFTATAMGYYDKEIAKAVVLAIFIPLIISSGGNSGSQAATLIIRAMAVKELSIRDWWYVMRREILAGLTLGIVLGSIGFLRISLWQELHWYNYGIHWLQIASTIFFALIGIVMWGTLSGSMIPIILNKLGIDPATSSAPFVATMVDVTGLIIYFSIADIMLKGTLL